MDLDLARAFRDLRKKHGSHFQAAKSLGISPDHYRKIRNKRADIPQRTAAYIILKASEISTPPPSPTDEARV